MAAYRVPDGQAVIFDAVRLLATAAVFLGHATKPDTLFDVDVALLGRATIPVFLMLSGYLTAAAMARGGVFWRRAARRYLGLWFVVVPAIPILLAADLWLIAQGSVILEDAKFDADLSPGAVLREAVQALTYSGEYWRLDAVGQGLFGNQAFWTVEYIMAYSVVTAALYLLDGSRRIAVVALAALVAGPTVVLLSPLWFAGVAAFEIHRRCAAAAEAERAGQPASAWAVHLRRRAAAIAAAGLAVVIAVEITGVGETAYLESKSWASYDWRQHLGMAKRFAWQWLLVPGLFLALVGSKYLIAWRPAPGTVAACRAAARYTLPVYVFHFSMIYVAESLIPGYRPRWTAPEPYAMMALALGLTLLLSWGSIRFCRPVADRLIARIA